MNYKSPFKTISIIIFCIILAIILREIVRAESVENNSEIHEAIPEYHQHEITQKTVSYLPTTERKIETYTITAYCSCEKCCGEWATKRNGGPVIGAYGVELTPGYSVAAPLPFGTKLIIDGKTYEVQDTTASWIVDRYAGRIIDIYCADHAAAIEFGKQVREVTVIE